MLDFSTLFKKEDPNEPVIAPTTSENVILIAAYLKKGIVTISHKQNVKTARFDDNSLRHMLKNDKHQKASIEQFVIAVAQLILSLSDDSGTRQKQFEQIKDEEITTDKNINK